jgi:hypothetical protein
MDPVAAAVAVHLAWTVCPFNPLLRLSASKRIIPTAGIRVNFAKE